MNGFIHRMIRGRARVTRALLVLSAVAALMAIPATAQAAKSGGSTTGHKIG